MNIFILEDSAERIWLFKNKLKDNNDLTFSDNVEASKTILSENKFDVLFFDHDLDGRVFVSSKDENTGYQLAKWIANETSIKVPQVIIHSMNPVGAENIRKEAEKFADEVHKIPFPALLHVLDKE